MYDGTVWLGKERRNSIYWPMELSHQDVEGGRIFLLTLLSSPKRDSFENRFNAEFMTALNRNLDKVEAYDKACALVMTSRGKYFSNGLDLTTFLDPKCDKQAFMNQFHGILARMTTFAIPTVAAINGHAFAGGFCLALSHDYRVMNSAKGFMCMNEIELNLALTDQMAALLKSKCYSLHVMRDVLLQAKRFNAQAALDAKLVDDIAEGETPVLEKAIQFASRIVKYGAPATRNTYAALKNNIYGAQIATMKAKL